MRGQIDSLFCEELEAGFSHVCRDHTRVEEVSTLKTRERNKIDGDMSRLTQDVDTKPPPSPRLPVQAQAT